MSIESDAAKELARIKALIPVIEAFLKGETVEYKFRGFTSWTEAIDPPWLKDCEYRIKPKPLTLYAVVESCGDIVTSDYKLQNAKLVASRRDGRRVVKLVEEV